MKKLHLLFCYLILFCSIIYLAGCNEEEEFTQDNLVDHALDINPEEAFPGMQGEVKQGYLFGEPITYEEIEGTAVFQGDIILTPEQLSEMQKPNSIENGRKEEPGLPTQGAGLTSRRWPNGVVIYIIDPWLPNQERVTDAIAHWEATTNLRFVRIPFFQHPRPHKPHFPSIKDNFTFPHIIFTIGKGCSSKLGMIGGRQAIRLATGCGTGAVIHEIGHAIGLFHEQSRTDRDNFIKIHYDNILSGKKHNFDTYRQKGYSGFNRGGFDFGSIMMYPSFSGFEIDKSKPSITRLDGSTFPRQRDALSEGDLAVINEMYPGASINLPTLSPFAGWLSGRLIEANIMEDTARLRFNEQPYNVIEGVVMLKEFTLEDRTIQTALHMHPRWVSNGTIKGWHPWVTLPQEATFEAEVGFIEGAIGTDGVSFQVIEHHMENGQEVWNRVAEVYKGYTGQLTKISADLSHLSGQKVGIELRVDAGASSGRDWAVWVNPRIAENPEIIIFH